MQQWICTGVVGIRPCFGSDAASHFKLASCMNFTCMYIAKFTSAIYVCTSLSKKPKTDQEYVHPNRAPETASINVRQVSNSVNYCSFCEDRTKSYTKRPLLSPVETVRATN